MKKVSVTQAIKSWNAGSLGMGPKADILIRLGPQREIPMSQAVFSETISSGRNGVIHVNTSRVEAVGICARGRRDGTNEDALGVVQKPDGSLLFHLADGFSVRNDAGKLVGGAEASASVLQGMELYCCGQYGSFDKFAAENTQRDLEVNAISLEAGSTYAGAMIQYDPDPELGYTKTDTLSIGDSRILACYDEEFELESISDSAAYRHAMRGAIRVWDPEYREQLKQELADKPDALRWLNGMDSYTPGRLQTSLWTFLQYMFPSSQILAHFDGKGINRQFLFRECLHGGTVCQKRGQQLFIYSDGVGDLFTPVDVMKAFRGSSKPLHEQVHSFAKKVMRAQEHGRKIDVGVGNKIKIGGKYDNYSFWAISMK